MILDYINQTVIENYDFCPHFFKMRKTGYEHKKREKVGQFRSIRHSNSSLVGQSIHAVLPIYVERGIGPALNALSYNLNSVSLFEEARGLLESLPEFVHRAPELKAEFGVKYKHRDLPECRSSFDFLLLRNDLVRVIELKTGWKILSKTDIEKCIEARWYAFMLKSCFSGVNCEIQYLYLRHGVLVTVNPDPFDLYDLCMLCTRINTDTEFSPNRSRCWQCDFVTHCKLGLSIGGVTDVAGLYVHHKAKADAYLELLQVHAKSGPISFGSWLFHYIDVKKREIKDMKVLLDYLNNSKITFKPDMAWLRAHFPGYVDDMVANGLLVESYHSRFIVSPPNK